MLRITLRDDQQTISFLGSEETARRLVAACASRPENVGELLVAAEVFERGLARTVMAGLMAFDKARQQPGPATTAAAEQQPFQVVDEATAEAARTPTAAGLLLVDLAARRIAPSPGLAIAREGEVLAADTGPTPRRITYTLPRDWTVEE